MKPTFCLLTTLFGVLFFVNTTSFSQLPDYEAIRQMVYNPTAPRDVEQSNKSSTVDSSTVVQSQKPKAPVNFDIYRDRNTLPVDPRKPCNECVTRQTNGCKKCKLACLPGFQGRPFRETEPGGCRCGKRCASKKNRPLFSVYWPSVANAIREEHHPCREARRAANLNFFRVNNLFDCLGGFELLPYERCDNGYCGKGRDRYGCLGESRYLQSNVSGVGFRLPGQPVPRNGIEYP